MCFFDLPQVITINGMFPGHLINATTNDFVHVNVFNNMDEPLLFTWYIYYKNLQISHEFESCLCAFYFN